MYGNQQQGIAASKNFTGVFYTELENNPAPTWIERIFLILISQVREEIIAFTKGFPGMREWVDERRIQSLSEFSTKVGTRPWELTVGINRDDIFFDRFNIIAGQIRGIAGEVGRHFVKYFVDLCLGGFAATGYDGANFFDANHPNGGGTVYSNTTANALSAAEYAAAKTKASKIRNSQTNKPLTIRFSGPNCMLMYGPNAETAQTELFQLQRLAGGQENIYYNAIPPDNRVLVPEFGDTAKWFLFDLNHAGMRPFVLHLVKGIDFVAFDSPSEWVVFSKNEYVYGVDTMDDATYFMPEVAYGSSVA